MTPHAERSPSARASNHSERAVGAPSIDLAEEYSRLSLEERHELSVRDPESFLSIRAAALHWGLL